MKSFNDIGFVVRGTGHSASKCAVLLAFLFVFGNPVSRPEAATFNVPAGDVAALIQAINDANSNGVADTIVLETSTFSLTSVHNDTDGPNGLPSVTTNITIEGDGSTIERANPGCPVDPQFRIFHVGSAGKLTLKNLTVQQGCVATNNGGGIRNQGGTLNIRDADIRVNAAAAGGGIYNVAGGTVNIHDSTINENFSSAAGGGIFNNIDAGLLPGTLNIHNAIIRQNRSTEGGGIINLSGMVYIHDTDISDNVVTSTGSGGGISNLSLEEAPQGMLSVHDSTIIDNESVLAGGGINNSAATANVYYTTISGNTSSDGAGIANQNDGMVAITHSTINDNHTTVIGGLDVGGGVFNFSGTVTIDNTTIFDNTGDFGGGVYNFSGTITVNNSTISANEARDGDGGGIFNNDAEAATANVGATIIANNTATGTGVNCEGIITDNGNNLQFPVATGCGLTDAASPPLAAALADNGGPTQTVALCRGAGDPDGGCTAASDAIDAIPGADCPPPSTDQRGIPRPQGAACDIGAYESSATVLEVLLAGNGSGKVEGELTAGGPPLIDCPSGNCIQGYGVNAMVDLTATAQFGSEFTGWTGDGACNGVITNPVPVDTGASGTVTQCTATFELLGDGEFLRAAIIGTQPGSVRLGDNVLVVQGDVIDNPVGGSVRMGVDAVVVDDVYGDTVVMGAVSTIQGDVFFNAGLTQAFGAQVGGAVNGGTAFPITELPPFEAAAPGGSDVRVGIRRGRLLTPGQYQSVVVGFGGTLALEPGEYDFLGLRMDPKARLVVLGGPTKVRIAAAMLLDTKATVVGTAAEVIFFVGADASLGDAVNVQGSIYSQQDIRTGVKSVLRGGYYARRLFFGTSSTIGLDVFQGF